MSNTIAQLSSVYGELKSDDEAALMSEKFIRLSVERSVRDKPLRYFKISDELHLSVRQLKDVLNSMGKTAVDLNQTLDSLRSIPLRSTLWWDALIRQIVHQCYNPTVELIFGSTSLFDDLLTKIGVSILELDQTHGFGYKLVDVRKTRKGILLFTSDMKCCCLKKKAKCAFTSKLINGIELITEKLGEEILYIGGRKIDFINATNIHEVKQIKMIGDVVEDYLQSHSDIVVVPYLRLVPDCIIQTGVDVHYKCWEKEKGGRTWHDIEVIRSVLSHIEVVFNIVVMRDLYHVCGWINWYLKIRTMGKIEQLDPVRTIKSLSSALGGEYPSISNKMNLMTDITRRAFGHVMRFTILGVLKRMRSELPIMIGSGIETVADVYRSGIRVIHVVNDYQEEYLTINSMLSELRVQGHSSKWIDNEYQKVNWTRSFGQKKLLAIDTPLIYLGYNVLYGGSSPGDHLMHFEWDKTRKLLCIDPNPLSKLIINNQFITHIKSQIRLDHFFELRNFVYIDDVRTDPLDGTKDLFWYHNIWLEMIEMYYRLICAVMTGECRAYSLKTRFHWRLPMIYLHCPIMQPYQHSKSFETRQFGLFDGSIRFKFSVNNLSYFNACKFWAIKRNVSNVSKFQKRALLNYFVARKKFSVDDVNGSDFIIAIFSLTDFINPSDSWIKMLSKAKRGIITVKHDWKSDNTVVQEKVGFKTYSDHVYDLHRVQIEQEDFRVYDLRDLVLSNEDNEWGNTNGFSSSYHQWKVVMKGVFPFSSQLQTIMNTQTAGVKLGPELLRTVFAQTDQTLYDVRRDVISSVGLTPILHGEFVGIDIKTQELLSVSGHIADVLLYSMFFRFVDLRRYVDVIEATWKAINGDKVMRNKITQALRTKKLVERDQLKIWHTYREFKLGIDYAQELLRIFGLKCSDSLFPLIRRELHRLTLV